MSSPVEMLTFLEDRLKAFAESYTAGFSHITVQISLPIDYSRADKYARGSYSDAIRHRALSLQAYQCGLLSAVHMSAGDIPGARTQSIIGKSLAREANDPIATAYTLIRRAALELHHGMLADALKHCASAVDQAKTVREHRPDLFAWALSLFARAAAIRIATRQEMDEAYRRAHHQAVDIAADLPEVTMNALTVTGPQVLGAVGDAASDAGDQGAVDLIERARAAYPRYSRLISYRTDLNLARALVRIGDTDAGIDLAMRTLTEAKRQDGPIEIELYDRGRKVYKALTPDKRAEARELGHLVA